MYDRRSPPQPYILEAGRHRCIGRENPLAVECERPLTVCIIESREYTAQLNARYDHMPRNHNMYFPSTNQKPQPNSELLIETGFRIFGSAMQTEYT